MFVRALSTVAAMALGSTALAAIPTMQISVSTVGGSSGSSSPTGVATGVANQFNYQGAFGGVGFGSSYNLNAYDTSATDRQILGGTVSLLNTSNATQSYVMSIMVSTVSQGASSLTGGSVSGTLTGDAGGGYFAAGGAVPGWTAIIRTGATDTTVASLWASAFSVTTDPSMANSIPGDSFGAPIPSQPSVAMGDYAIMRFAFDLGAGDRADFSTVFVIQSAVPAPGAIAALALLGVPCRRRRA